LNIIDEYTRECLWARVERWLSLEQVLDKLTWLPYTRGIPAHIRSDNGLELAAQRIRKRRSRMGIGAPFIEKDSPRENGYIESFNGKIRDELPNREILLACPPRPVPRALLPP
jgi:putative transposase